MGEEYVLVVNKMGVDPLGICTCTYSDVLFELLCLMISCICSSDRCSPNSLNTILVGAAKVFSSISKTLNTKIKLFWVMTFSIFRNRVVKIWPNLLSSAMKLRCLGKKKKKNGQWFMERAKSRNRLAFFCKEKCIAVLILLILSFFCLAFLNSRMQKGFYSIRPE